MKRAVAYARYSTDKQHDTSIEKQLADIREYCKKKEYTLVKEYVDRAESASKEDRPAFQQLLADAHQHLFDVVVVHKLNRLARNRYLSVVTAHELRQYGVTIESVLEPISEDPAGQLLWGILDAVNEFERLQTIQETKLKMKQLAKHGFWLGGRTPFGFRAVKVITEDGKTHTRLEVDENEAPIVREIFKLFLQGYSYKTIAEKLNDKKLYNRGKPWRASTVSAILQSPRYVGQHFWGRGTKYVHHIVRPDAIYVNGPAIVDRETWKEAQKRKSQYVVRRPSRYPYLLRNLAFCECGAPLYGHTDKTPGYRCKRYSQDATKHVYISAAKLEGFVKGYLDRILDKSTIDFDRLAKAINEVWRERMHVTHEEAVRLREEAEQLEEEIHNLTVALAKVAPSAQERIIEQINTLSARLDHIREQMNAAEIEVQLITPERLQEIYDTLIQKVRDERLEEVIRMLIKKVIVYKSGYIAIQTTFLQTPDI